MKILPIPRLEFLPVAVMATVLSGCRTTTSVEASSTRNPVVAPAGSVLRVRLNETLETGRSRPGDRFSGVLDSALVSGSAEILPKGTRVEGHVTAVQTPGLNSSGLRPSLHAGRAALAITLDGFEIDGQQFPLIANVVKRTAPEPVRHVEIDADTIIGFTLTSSLVN